MLVARMESDKLLQIDASTTERSRDRYGAGACCFFNSMLVVCRKENVILAASDCKRTAHRNDRFATGDTSLKVVAGDTEFLHHGVQRSSRDA